MKIVIENLSKSFSRESSALSDVNLVIENGVFGLIGPNASGKTTLLRILATLLKQSGGTARFDSYDLSQNRAEIRAMTGYMPQRFSQFTRLKAWEFLDYSGSLAGVSDKKNRREEMEELLDALGLAGVRDEFANDLSPVMKRHLEIAQAVIGSPRILLVDEPTLGLSPEERIRFRSLLNLKSGRVEVIIVTSHIFSDISSTCDRVAVLNEGRVVFDGPPSDVPDQESRRGWAIDGPPPGSAPASAPDTPPPPASH